MTNLQEFFSAAMLVSVATTAIVFFRWYIYKWDKKNINEYQYARIKNDDQETDR